MKIGVMIPAYNEADKITQTIRAVKSIPEIHEIVVIDDGSTDATASAALREGVRVVWHQENYGKGQALKTGFQSLQSDIVVLVDADIGEQAVEVQKLIEPIQAGLADMTIAIFPPVQGKQGFGLVKKLAIWGIHRLTGFYPQAPLSGQRAIRKELLKKLHIANGYGVEVAMTIDALHAGYHVLEVPVEMYNREYGRSLRGFIHRGRQFIHIARTLFERWAEKKTTIGGIPDGMEVKK